jgi:hypothetical protein
MRTTCMMPQPEPTVVQGRGKTTYILHVLDEADYSPTTTIHSHGRAITRANMSQPFPGLSGRAPSRSGRGSTEPTWRVCPWGPHVGLTLTPHETLSTAGRGTETPFDLGIGRLDRRAGRKWPTHLVDHTAAVKATTPLPFADLPQKLAYRCETETIIHEF